MNNLILPHGLSPKAMMPVRAPRLSRERINFPWRSCRLRHLHDSNQASLSWPVKQQGESVEAEVFAG